MGPFQLNTSSTLDTVLFWPLAPGGYLMQHHHPDRGVLVSSVRVVALGVSLVFAAIVFPPWVCVVMCVYGGLYWPLRTLWRTLRRCL